MREIRKKTDSAAVNGDQPESTEHTDWGAFVDRGVQLAPTGNGSLNGLNFAVKDVFDIEGFTSGAGNPDWLRTHQPSKRTAPAIRTLLANGARLEGTTQTDELMYSLNGQNAHYGTPVNPAAPKRIPGGSSSGSAAAAAAGLVNFAVGTDTGGSVRIPSSYCGLYGFRPTHGRVSVEGVIPLAESFDTVGWMSRGASTLLKVGEALLGEHDYDRSGNSPFSRFFTAEEPWSLLEEDDCEALQRRLRAIDGWQEGGTLIPLTTEEETLADWSAAFRILQGLQIWRQHGAWIEREKPSFGPGIAERFQWASTLQDTAGGPEAKLRERVRSGLIRLLGEDGLLAIPTAPGPAPLLGLEGAEAEIYRAKTMQLSCIAGLSGLPQVTVPVIRTDGLPIGLSWIGGPGSDLNLLSWTAEQFTREVRL